MSNHGGRRAAWLVLALVLSAFVGPANSIAAPKCALLTDDKLRAAGVADLLFTALAAESTIELVERDQLNKALRELDLSTAFGPADGPTRLRLGKLLRADVLLIARHIATPEPHYELVAAETKQGLRLLRSSRQVTTAAEDAAALRTAAQQALDKLDAEIRVVCAVPPLVSDDLNFEYDHLRTAFAKILEEAIAKRPGVLLVEFSEAQAIAREVSLGDGEGVVRRPLPYYVLGRYRHLASDREVSLELVLQHGEKSLVKLDDQVDDDQVVEHLLSRAVELAARLNLGVDSHRFDANVEAKLLAERSQVFQTLGNWDEAAAMAEASLLLAPDQIDVRRQCVNTYARLAAASFVTSNSTVESVSRGLRAHVRGLEHLEMFFGQVGDLRQYRRDRGDDWSHHYQYMRSDLLPRGLDQPRGDESVYVATATLREEVRQVDFATALRILKMRAKAGHSDSCDYMYWVVDQMPEDRRSDLIFSVCEELADLPDAVQRTIRFSTFGKTAWVLDNTAGDAYLKRLEASKHDALRHAAATLRRHVIEHRQRMSDKFKRRPIPGPRPIPPEQPLQFEEVKWDFVPLSGKRTSLENFAGIVRAGRDIDVVCQNWWLGVMKEAGLVREIWNSGNTANEIRFVSFDGKYVWARVAYNSGPPSLVVMDPVSEQTWQITSEDFPLLATKSPAGSYGAIAVCGYAPGKACVVGAIERTWVALVDFDPLAKQPFTSEIVLEAKKVVNPDVAEQWKQVDLAFVPDTIRMVPGDPHCADENLRGPRILVNRVSPVYEARAFPLVVDPVRRKVSLFEHALTNAVGAPSDRWILGQQGHSLYMVGFNLPHETAPRLTNLWLHRLDWPEFRTTPQFIDPPPGRVLFHDGETYIVGRKWWRVDLDKSSVSLLGEVPWHFEPAINPPVQRGDFPEFLNVPGPDTLEVVDLESTNVSGLVAWSWRGRKDFVIHAIKFEPARQVQKSTEP